MPREAFGMAPMPAPRKTESVGHDVDIQKKGGPAPESVLARPHENEEIYFDDGFEENAEAHGAGPDFEEAQAEKVLSGLVTPEELAVKFGPAVMDAVMKRAQVISEVNAFSEKAVPEKTIYPKIPHPLHGIIPRVLEHYNHPDRTEDDEQEFLDLLGELRKDGDFKKLLEQYAPLIALNPDRTEEYEMKAMKDFVELNKKLA